MFDEKTCQELKAYVYMLIDPRDDQRKPFYVGKGNNNRVFDHVKTAIKDGDILSLKYDLINEIQKKHTVEHLIVRHGLSDKEAYHLECGIIDVIEHLGFPLTNIVNGHNSLEKGIMTTDMVVARNKADHLTNMDSDCVIININKTYKRNSGQNAVYQATKETWRMSDPKNKIKFVLSEYRGLIVEVFEVEEWYTKTRKSGPNSKLPNKEYEGWGFNGKVADEIIRKKYIYKSIAHLKKKGASNVIKYSNVVNLRTAAIASDAVIG